MAIRFRSPLLDPDRPRYSINWPMVRLAFTTRDGLAYLIQLIILFGTIGLIFWTGRDFLITGSLQSLIVASWLSLIIMWPDIRRGIRFKDWR